jgi:hypothetical protein
MALDYGSMTPAQQANFVEALKTNPDFLASFAPQQDNGWSEDNSQLTLYNPMTGQNETIDVAYEDRGNYNPAGDNVSWGYDPDGNRVLIDTSNPDYRDQTYRDQSGDKQGGLTVGVNPVDESQSGGGGGFTTGGGSRDPNRDRETNVAADGSIITEDSDPFIERDPIIPPGFFDTPYPEDNSGNYVEEEIEVSPNQPPVDTSWDWDAFKPKGQGDGAWGGYDEDYQAFERYQPGMDSPWGMPNIEGGNEDFYRQQFVNQLRDEQGYRSRQRDAQGRRQDAIDNPIEAAPMDWSWANNGKGLGETQVSTGIQEDNRQYGLGFGMDRDTTNTEFIRRMLENNAITDDQYRSDAENFLTPNDSSEWDAFNNSTHFSSFNNPTDAINSLGPDLADNNRAFLSDMFNTAYQKQGKQGAAVPIGYAQPLATYSPTGST